MSSKKDSLRLTRLLWPFLKPYKLYMAGALLSLIMASFTVLLMGWGLRNLVDYGFSGGDVSVLNTSLLVLLMIITILAMSSYGRFYFVSSLGEHMIADIRKKVYNHLIRLDLFFFETRKRGEIISRLTSDATVLQLVVSNTIPTAMRNILMFFGGLVMLCYTSPKLTGFVLVVIPLVIVPIIFFGRRVRKKSKLMQDSISHASGYIDETLHAVPTIQSFSQETRASSEFATYADETVNTAMHYIRVRAVLTAFVIFMVFTAIGIVLWIGGHDVIEGHMSSGELSAFVFYAIVMASSAGALGEVFGALQRASGAAEGLLSILDVKSNIREPQFPKDLPKHISGKIEFKNLSFKYPTRKDSYVLQNINFTAKSGETIAIVGPSGSGKTTLFQLLLCFYDVKEGCIKIDDIDAVDITSRDIRQHIAVVPQDPVIFSTSVLENIRYAVPEATIEEVKKAAKLAHADNFIEKLLNQYDTLLGERGCLLSGGQKQRIAIARAILKNPDILLLDEATSSLDSQNEFAVQEALTSLMKDRTTLVIAHRLSTIQNADKIIVLEDGKVVATGTHKSLRKDKDGLYAKMLKLQQDIAE